jgi:hypothetical protein
VEGKPVPGENSQQDLFKKAPIWWEGLTGRRRAFVEYYCGDKSCYLNQSAAYIKAFTRHNKELADSSIQSNAARLMRDPKIQSAIQKLLRAKQNEEDQLTEYEILRLLKVLSLYNPADIIDRYGNLKVKESIEELGELALCVTGVKKSRNGDKEIKLYDRTKSLAILCNYLELTRPADGATIVNPVVYLAGKDMEALRDEENINGQKEKPVEDAEYELVEAEA